MLDPADLAADLTIDNLVETYLEHWIEDIEDGLENWSDLGLASTRALFDPRSRRAAQNHICRNEPDDENSLLRRNCEDGVGPLDVLSYESEDFINDHLISMLGAPDLVGDLNELFGVVSDTLDDVLGPALNPLQAPIAELKEYAKELIKEKIEEELHIDVDQLKSFVTSPTHWLGVQSVSLTLPGLGTQQLDLFAPETHTKLDTLMALPADHHTDQQVTLPGVGHDPQHRPQRRGGVRPRAVRGLPQHRPDGEAAAARRPRPQRRARRHPGRARGRQGPDLDLRGRRQPDGQPALGLAAVAALDRLRPLLALRRPPALLLGRRPGLPGRLGRDAARREARRRQRHLPAVGVLPAAPDVHHALPRLGERQRPVPGARRRAERGSE